MPQGNISTLRHKEGADLWASSANSATTAAIIQEGAMMSDSFSCWVPGESVASLVDVRNAEKLLQSSVEGPTLFGKPYLYCLNKRCSMSLHAVARHMRLDTATCMRDVQNCNVCEVFDP